MSFSKERDGSPWDSRNTEKNGLLVAGQAHPSSEVCL